MTTTTASTMPRYSWGQGKKGLISRSFSSSSSSEHCKKICHSPGARNYKTQLKSTETETSPRQGWLTQLLGEGTLSYSEVATKSQIHEGLYFPLQVGCLWGGGWIVREMERKLVKRLNFWERERGLQSACDDQLRR